MRLRIALAMSMAFIAGASAQNSYYAERGHWLVSNGSDSCFAINRPFAEFNYAPYNALQIVAEPGFLVGVRVMFWPGAVEYEREYDILLTFDHVEPIRLPAVASAGDFTLAVEPTMNRDLWKQLQTADQLIVTVLGEPSLDLLFTMEDPAWLSKALRDCLTILPPPS